MKLTGTFIRTEEKRMLRILPQYFLGVFLLTALIGLVVVFSAAVTKKDLAKSDMSIALVLNENAFLGSFGIDVLESSTSVSSMAKFVKTDEETAMKGLDDGTYSGVVIFPDHFIGGVFSGDDIRAEMILPKIFGFNNNLMAALSDIVGTLFQKTETGIEVAAVAAATDERADEHDINRVSADVEGLFFDFVMSREDFYSKDSASGTGNQTVVQYYICAAFVLLLLLGGISCGTLLKGDPVAFEKQLALHRIGPAKLLGIRYLSVLSMFAILDSTIFALLCGWKMIHPVSFENVLNLATFEEIGYWYVCGLPVLLLAAAIVVFVYTFAANQIGGILLLFIAVMVMGYASGLLAPAAYLPSKVRVLGAYLPTTRMLNVMKNGMTHAVSVPLLITVAVEACIVLAVSMAIFSGKRRWAE